MGYQRAHAPIYGYMKGYKHTIPLHLVHYARTFSIFKLINRIPIGRVLNVGGADGYHSYLINKLYGVDVITLDIDTKQLEKAKNNYKIPVKEGSALNIPYPDNSFDTVLCIETLEHIATPLKAVEELKRVAKSTVIISTESFFDSEEQKTQFLNYIRETHPQFFRNTDPVQSSDVSYFTREDFYNLFNTKRLFFYPQFSSKIAEITGNIDFVRNFIKSMTNNIEINKQTKVIVHFMKNRYTLHTPQLSEEDLLKNIVTDKPLFPQEYDEEMRKEDEENIHRITKWHEEKKICNIISPESTKTLVIDEDGAKHMKLQWLTSEDLERSPSFCTRRITLDPNGTSPERKTSWEHQLYIISGRGKLVEESKSTTLDAGLIVHVRPNLSFKVVNTTDEKLIYLDIIPSITSFFGR